MYSHSIDNFYFNSKHKNIIKIALSYANQIIKLNLMGDYMKIKLTIIIINLWYIITNTNAIYLIKVTQVTQTILLVSNCNININKISPISFERYFNRINSAIAPD